MFVAAPYRCDVATKPDLSTVAGRVLHVRTASGLTRLEFSKACAIAPSLVGFLEREERESPSTKTVRRIAKAFKLDAGWLAFGEGKAPDEARIAAAGKKYLASARKAA